MTTDLGTTRRWVVRAAFAVWAGGVLVAGAYVFGPHGLAFAQGGSGIENRPETGGWVAVHVVSEGCGCSGRVVRRLAERGAKVGVSERVVTVGKLEAGMAEKLKAAGFAVEGVSGDEVEAKYGVQGGPWLMVWGKGGEAAYSGGYAGRQISGVGDVRDGEIIDRLLRGERVEPYAAFGCAIGQKAKRAVDPLGVLGN